MPEETKNAIQWALQQTVIDPLTQESIAVTKNTRHELVDKVREYFNDNNIEYSTFVYDDLIPYLE